MKQFLLLLCAVIGAAAVTPELLPVHNGRVVKRANAAQQEPEVPELGAGRALLSVREESASVNNTLVDPFRIVRDPVSDQVVGQVTSDATAAVNATELCIFLNGSIPVDNETYSVEAFARQDDSNSSIVYVSDVSVQVVNESYYCANVTNGTYYTALIEAPAAATTSTPSTTGSTPPESASTSNGLSTGVIAAIVISAVFAVAVLAVVLALVLRPRERQTFVYYEGDGTGDGANAALTGQARIEQRHGRRPVRGVSLPRSQAQERFAVDRPGHRAQMRLDVRKVRGFQ